MSSDPSTRTGARALALRYPVGMPDLLMMGAVGVRAELMPFKGADEVRRDEGFSATPSEEREALAGMSAIWGGAE